MAAIKDAFLPSPYTAYTIMAVYIALCLIYLILGMKLGSGLLKAVLKAAPLLFLLGFFVYIVSSLHIGPVQPVGDVTNLERLFFGLAFSCLGDCYLVFDSFFIHGLLAFACAHLIYIYVFNGAVLLFAIPGQSELTTAVAIGLVSLLVYFYVLPKLGCVLVVPAAMYCVLISLMLWCALVTLQYDPRPSTLQGALGACLFYTSDLILTLNRWRLQIPFGPHVIMITYYAAQFLIFFSIINTF